MTRIFLATMPMTSHVRPALPIARELVAAGHDVFWRGGRGFAEQISATGATFTPIGRHLDFDEDSTVLATVDERRPGVPRFKQVARRVFIDSVPAHLADLAPMFDAVRPDVVFSDFSLLAAPILAARRGVRTVLFVGGPLPLAGTGAPPPGAGLLPARSPVGRLRDRSLRWLVTHVLFRDVQQALRRSLAGLGMPPVDTFFMNWPVQLAEKYLVMTVPEFEYPREDLPAAVEFVGPTPPDRPAGWVPPPWWPELGPARADGRPVVLVTAGDAPAANPATLLPPTVTALAGQDVLVLAETGACAPDDLLPADRRPANLRLAGSLPPTEVLPMVDLVVTSGGYDSVQSALAHGVPLVVTGVSDNRLEANNRVRWSGAGVFLKTWRPEPARLRAAATEVLRDPRYRTAAERLRESYAGHAGARRAAEVILEVAGARTP